MLGAESSGGDKEEFLGEESGVEGVKRSLIKFQPGLGLLCEAESKAIGSLPCRKCLSSSSRVLLSFSLLEVQVQFTQRGAACPGHCTCRSSSDSLEKCDGFGGCLLWVSQVVFGGVLTVMLDLGQ